MQLRYKLIAVTAVALNVFLTNCATTSDPCGSTPPVYIYPQIQSLNVNASSTFNATDHIAANTTWAILNPGGGNVGTINQGTGASVLYSAPSSPPIYGPNQIDPSVQGKVTLQANLAGECAGSYTVTFSITAPSVTTGISPATANVALGATAQFYAYAVGSTNNALTFQVNGVTGGSTATGTVSAMGLYTAPTLMPMSGNTITLTAVSSSDPTKTSTATITLH